MLIFIYKFIPAVIQQAGLIVTEYDSLSILIPFHLFDKRNGLIYACPSVQSRIKFPISFRNIPKPFLVQKFAEGKIPF